MLFLPRPWPTSCRQTRPRKCWARSLDRQRRSRRGGAPLAPRPPSGHGPNGCGTTRLGRRTTSRRGPSRPLRTNGGWPDQLAPGDSGRYGATGPPAPQAKSRSLVGPALGPRRVPVPGRPPDRGCHRPWPEPPTGPRRLTAPGFYSSINVWTASPCRTVLSTLPVALRGRGSSRTSRWSGSL